jgi:hypothetical protein
VARRAISTSAKFADSCRATPLIRTGNDLVRAALFRKAARRLQFFRGNRNPAAYGRIVRQTTVRWLRSSKIPR